MHIIHERIASAGLRPSSSTQLILRLLFAFVVVVIVPNGTHDVSADRPLSSSVHSSSFTAGVPLSSHYLFPWRCSRCDIRTMSGLRGGGGGGEGEINWSLNKESSVKGNIDPSEVDMAMRRSHQPPSTISYPCLKSIFPPTRWRLSGRRYGRERRRLHCSDVRECRSPSLFWPDEVVWTATDFKSVSLRGGADWFGTAMDDDDNVDEFPLPTDSSTFAASSVRSSINDIETSRGTLDGDVAGTKNNPKKVRRSHSPVVYQYYGRSRNRGQSSPDAPHFLLLGPNVDHWKAVGQILASRGFNVMVCERIIDAEETTNAATSNNKSRKNWKLPQQQDSNDEANDAPDLVLDMLDLLKWNKAVLVGCDEESILAMETAMILAPDRICGLILCGDLTKANRLAVEAGGVNALDTLLHRILDCPFVIIWDGDGTPAVVSGSSARAAVETDNARCVILGGGSAPYRTKPEQFAWVLTRFVEEKLEYHSMHSLDDGEGPDGPRYPSNPARQNRGGILQNLNLPFAIDSLVSPEGRLLLGRAVAAAIFYASIMKVLIVQYGILRAGLISVKTSVDSVDALRRKLFHAVSAFVWNFGYLPRLFKFSLKKTREMDEDDMSSRKSDSVNKLEDEELEGTSPPDPETNFDSKSEDVETEVSGKDTEDPPEQEERSRFKPFFFLDNIIT